MADQAQQPQPNPPAFQPPAPVVYQKTSFSSKDILFRFPALGLFLMGTIIHIVDSFSKREPTLIDLGGFGVSYKGSLSSFMFIAGVIVFIVPIAKDLYSVWKYGKSQGDQ